MRISNATVGALLCVGAVSFTAAWAGPSDGSVVGVTKIVDNGSAAERFNLVLLAEGFTNEELDDFAARAQEFADFLQATPPFSTSCRSINIYRVDVASTDSGADDPAPPDDNPATPGDESDLCAGGTGASRSTYFDATFCGDGVIRRLLVANSGTAIDVLNANVPEWDQALLIVNTNTYGGSGGSVGVTSTSGTWENIAIHEFGHSAFGLADEYEYWAGCGVDTDRSNHPMAEPAEPNVTIETDRTLVKWSDLIAATTSVPTTNNADCSTCDSQADPSPGAMVVGLYEGAHYYHCSAYRPTFSCMMRNFAPFCPVCTRRIEQTLAAYTPANAAPTCSAGGPYVAECTGANTQVQLDGSGSSDLDCNALAFSWSGPFSGGVASGQSPLVQFAGLGNFVVDLSVDDGTAASACSAPVAVQDTNAPTLVAPADVVVECASAGGTVVALGTPAVSDVCDPTLDIVNDAPASFPLGTTPVEWTATDSSSNSSVAVQNVTVADSTPPTLSVVLSSTLLWPPNHRLVSIQATITTEDVCDASPTVRLVSITSDEPGDGLGDGATAPDIQDAAIGTDDRSFRLRAERDGSGDGRVYTVTYEVEDGSGNKTTAQAYVSVPKSQ